MLARYAVVTLAVSLTFGGSLAAAQSKGTLQAAINYPAGPATVPSNTGFLLGGILPIEVHTGDFNGDGTPDVVVAAGCSQPTFPAGSGSPGIPGCPASGYAVVIYLGKGDGTFGSPIISGGMAPGLRSIAVGDFNGDGKLDIAAISDCLSNSDCSSGSMTILLGNGDGTLTTGFYSQLGGVVIGANTVTVGDMNGDGKLDLVVGIGCYNIPLNGCSVGVVSIYLGNGDGTFPQAPLSYSGAGNGAIPVALGDFNKDGKLDVIAVTPGPALTFLPGDGHGTLGTPSSTSLPIGGQAITAADFNRDGNLDAVASDGHSGIVLVGNGDGTFQAPVGLGSSLNSAVTDGASIVVMDLNDDGWPDVALSGSLFGFNGVQVFVNDGSGNLTAGSTYTAGGWLYAPIAVADFNGDGKNDIVLASGFEEDAQNADDGTISILLGNGDGTMRSVQYFNENYNGAGTLVASAAAAADFNGDGFQDLIFPSGCGPGVNCTPSGFTLLLSNGAGGFQTPLSFTAPVNGANYLAVADFNGDGKPDVAVFNNCDASCAQTSVSIFLNTGNGTFSAPVVYEGGGVTPLTIVTGDFNGDGKTDIAVLNALCAGSCIGQGVIAILLGNGDGTFQPVVTTNFTSGPEIWIAAANFNGDGKTDLVVVEGSGTTNDPYAGIAQILLSNGDGTFTQGNAYATGGDRSGSATGMAVATGDLNGDGIADIVIGNLCEPIARGQIAYDVNCANGAIGVLLGNGDGTFQYGPSYSTIDANLRSMALADVNGDGKLDYIASTTTGVAVAFGNGDGTFQPPTVYAALTASWDIQMAIADLNGDGGLDIVQPGSNGELAILYNQGFAKSTPTVALQSSLSPSTFGQTVTFTSTVTSPSGTPTGTITFTDGSNTLGTATLANGSASLSTNALGAGTHSIIAAYSGDASNSPATSASLQQVVNKATVSIVLLSSVNPSYVNQTVYFSVEWSSQFGAPVSGTVAYMQGTTVLAVEPLNVPYSTTYTTTGTRSITAIYSGDNDNLGSTSQILKQVVKALPAATKTVVTTSGSPSFINLPLMFTVTVSSTDGPIPDGELMTFSDGATTLASVPLAGSSATYTTSTLKAGNHTIKATYPGDSTFKTSSGSVKQVITLNPSSSSVPSSTLNPSIYGQPITLSSTVTSTAPSTPTGTVTFKNGTMFIGTATLNASGVATLTKTNLPAGPLSITATYNGDSETARSTSQSLAQTVNQATTTTGLTSSRNPSTQGQLVKFTATVTSPTTTPMGAVTFMDGSTVLGTGNLAGGKASLSTPALGTGSHNITAVYGGTANIVGSTSGVIVQLVN